MNRAKIILISLLGLCSSLCNAGEANEDITRALIVARLLNYVDWQAPEPAFIQKSKRSFKLCIYDDRSISRIFNKHLKELQINQKAIQVENIVDKLDAASCHALYIPQPNKEILNWLVSNNVKNKTVLVAEGQGYVQQGVHLNIYLNKKGFFDFELNADAFVDSLLNVNQELLSLERVVGKQVNSKASLLRSLINYTNWPSGLEASANIKAEAKTTFEMCAYQHDAFATFVHYFLSGKTLKSKPVQLRQVEKDESVASCQLLFVSNDSDQLLKLMPGREKQAALLVGNTAGLGEKGVHFNLETRESVYGRRFEINLLAFNQTGHLPGFELLNSAKVVDKDYPAITQILSRIIQATINNAENSPGKEADHKIDYIDLCVYQDLSMLDNLQLFLPGYSGNSKSVRARVMSDLTVKKSCQAIFVGEQEQLQRSLSQIKQSYPHALLITSQIIDNKNKGQMPMHFNLLLKSNQVSFEHFEKNLISSGFEVAKELFESTKVIGGRSDD